MIIPARKPSTNGSMNKLLPQDQPIHDWYRFVLSFPPHLVDEYIHRFGLRNDETLLHPFCGTGTTLVEAKRLGISSVGIEAHPMSHFASQVKVEMSDEELRSIIQNPKVEIYVLYVAGVPAGYAELDRRNEFDLELAYFGIVPEFIGQRLGPFLLDWMIDKAWSYQPRRFWLHTCDLDHPKALAVYQRAGFVPYKQETKIIDDPRLIGLR